MHVTISGYLKLSNFFKIRTSNCMASSAIDDTFDEW